MPANLGLATNEDMMRELICRFKMEQYTNGSAVTTSLAIERALILSEMLGGMGAPEREYRTTDEAPKVRYNSPLKKTHKKRGPQLSREDQKARNERMNEAFEQGLTYGQIARQHNLTEDRVKQIIKKK